jgi:uncharacterized protein YeaO (DUF488 family)
LKWLLRDDVSPRGKKGQGAAMDNSCGQCLQSTMSRHRPAGEKSIKPRSRQARTPPIAIKRAYDKPSPHDGMRILIDRLWPRGVTKAKLKLDAWPREVTPSTALRKWYGHDPKRFAEFRRRYRAELSEHRDALDALRAMIKGSAVTLITATRELDLSHAEVLREILQRKRK